MIEIFEKYSREIPTAVTEARVGAVGYMGPRYHSRMPAKLPRALLQAQGGAAARVVAAAPWRGLAALKRACPRWAS
jgi:hypothetical protein